MDYGSRWPPEDFRLVLLEVKTLVATKKGLSKSHSCQIGSALRNRPHSPWGSWCWLWKLIKKEGRQGRGKPGSLGYFCTQKDLDTSCGIIFLIFSFWWPDSLLNIQSARFSPNLPGLLLVLLWAVQGTNGIRKDCYMRIGVDLFLSTWGRKVDACGMQARLFLKTQELNWVWKKPCDLTVN